jgi:multicomponent K+:H+ antiporter subunit G
VIITVFILMTAPVVSMLLIRAAIYRDLRAGKTGRKKGVDDAYGALPKE